MSPHPVPEEKITILEQSPSVMEDGDGGTGEGQERDTVALLLYPKLHASVKNQDWELKRGQHGMACGQSRNCHLE